MNGNVQDILNELPVTVVELPNFDDTELVLHIQRLKDGADSEGEEDVSWFAYYADPEDGTYENGTLTGAGKTLVEALNELLHNYQTDFKQWQEDNKESIE